MKSIFKDEFFQGKGLALLFVILLAFLVSLTGCSADIPGVQGLDHAPADSVTTGVEFSLDAPEVSKKGDYYIFEQNYDCVQVYEDGNKFHISGPMPGDNQFLILKYPDGTGIILNMSSGHWLTIYKDLCNVQISYFWADPESYTFTEAQNMAKAIFAGAMVERPGTETCTVQKLCNPDALTGNE